MPFAGTVIGAFLGLTTKLGSNVLQKVPYMRRTCLLRDGGKGNLLCRHVSNGDRCCLCML